MVQNETMPWLFKFTIILTTAKKLKPESFEAKREDNNNLKGTDMLNNKEKALCYCTM